MWRPLSECLLALMIFEAEEERRERRRSRKRTAARAVVAVG